MEIVHINGHNTVINILYGHHINGHKFWIRTQFNILILLIKISHKILF